MGLLKARTPRPVDSCALGADSARIPDLTIYGTDFLPIRQKPLPTLTPINSLPRRFSQCRQKVQERDR